ncbi:MAG: dihydropteroate synthase [Gemmobacter sp.]|nr:dihydropteroate synthase [Gemmobacter sp.]
MIYWRPIPMTDPARPAQALALAGGWCWFDRIEVLERGMPARIIPASDAPADVIARLIAPRAMLAGLALDRPRIMGILNVTPDSFSDGGRFLDPARALDQGRKMAEDADLLDIGGESTRPGAPAVSVQQEIARTAPVIAALREAGLALPISIDTRKADVAEAAMAAGAQVVNDVSGLVYDPALAGLVARHDVPVCVMHARGTPETMQAEADYDDVLLDVYDGLADCVARAVAAGIARDRILVDPGIGFAKTGVHNLALIARLSLFHGMGCPILLGASRKRFIGTYGGAEAPDQRMPGSVAVALAGVAQGAQVVRVHDVAETRQALRVWLSLRTAGADRMPSQKPDEFSQGETKSPLGSAGGL